MVEKAQVNPQGLMSIGAVAAANIASFLNLPAEHIGTIEQAIRDEITAMSSHFTLAIADVQTSYELDLAKVQSESDAAKTQYVADLARVKSTFSFVKAHGAKIAAINGVLFAAGALLTFLIFKA